MTEMHKIWNIDLGTDYREEELDGRHYIVVPMVMILEGVHTGSQGPVYYSIDELAKTPKMWNLKPIVIEHPFRGDTATDLEVYKRQSVGMVMNTHFTDGKLKAEAWIDIEKAQEKCPTILEHIKHRLPMEISTGLFSELVLEEGVWNGEPYKGRIINIRADHLAILPQKQGACSLSDGAGLLINQRQDIDSKEVLNVISTVVNQEYVAGSNVVLDEEDRKHLHDKEAKVKTENKFPEHEDKTDNKIEGGSQVQEFTTPDGFKVIIRAPGNKKFNVPEPNWDAGSSIDYTEDMMAEPEQDEEPLQDNARIVPESEVEEGDKDVIELLEQFYRKANKILRTKNGRVVLKNYDEEDTNQGRLDRATYKDILRGENRMPTAVSTAYKGAVRRKSFAAPFLIEGSDNADKIMDSFLRTSEELDRNALEFKRVIQSYIKDFMEEQQDYIKELKDSRGQEPDPAIEEEIKTAEDDYKWAETMYTGLTSGLMNITPALMSAVSKKPISEESVLRGDAGVRDYLETVQDDDDELDEDDLIDTPRKEDKVLDLTSSKKRSKYRYTNVESKDGERGFDLKVWYEQLFDFIRHASAISVQRGKWSKEAADSILGMTSSYATYMKGKDELYDAHAKQLKNIPANTRVRIMDKDELAKSQEAYSQRRSRLEGSAEIDKQVRGAADWLSDHMNLYDVLNRKLTILAERHGTKSVWGDFVVDDSLIRQIKRHKIPLRTRGSKSRQKVENASDAKRVGKKFDKSKKEPVAHGFSDFFSPAVADKKERMYALYSWFTQGRDLDAPNLPILQARDTEGMEKTLDVLNTLQDANDAMRNRLAGRKGNHSKYKAALTELSKVINLFKVYITQYIKPLSEAMNKYQMGTGIIKNMAVKNEVAEMATVVFNACLCYTCPEAFGLLDSLWDVLHPFHALPAFKGGMSEDQYNDLSFMAACLSAF